MNLSWWKPNSSALWKFSHGFVLQDNVSTVNLVTRTQKLLPREEKSLLPACPLACAVLFSVLVSGFNRAKPTESGEIKFYGSQKGNLNKENIVQRLSFVIKFHWILKSCLVLPSHFRRQQRFKESYAVGVSWSHTARPERSASLQLRGAGCAALQRQMVSRHFWVLPIHALRASAGEDFLLQHRN